MIACILALALSILRYHIPTGYRHGYTLYDVFFISSISCVLFSYDDTLTFFSNNILLTWFQNVIICCGCNSTSSVCIDARYALKVLSGSCFASDWVHLARLVI